MNAFKVKKVLEVGMNIIFFFFAQGHLPFGLQEPSSETQPRPTCREFFLLVLRGGSYNHTSCTTVQATIVPTGKGSPSAASVWLKSSPRSLDSLGSGFIQTHSVPGGSQEGGVSQWGQPLCMCAHECMCVCMCVHVYV